MKDDAALVAAALAGGPEAFGPIVERYKDAVFGVALARLRNFHDAEDVCQVSFIEAFERLGHLRDPCRLGAWLRSIAIHRCINYQRRRNRIAANEPIEDFPEAGLTPQDEVEHRELSNRVMAAIGRLSKVQRETVTLFYINGYSQKEVAAIQEAPLGTIKRRLHDARHKLKKEMVEMVEEVLKDGAPGEDFAERVFELLCGYPEGAYLWKADTMDALKQIGALGREGFVRALSLPHWKTRRAAVHYLGWAHLYGGAALPVETAIDLLKKALVDGNRRVRTHAIWSLLTRLDATDRRLCEHVLPLVTQRLLDCSKKVRYFVAGKLTPWVAYVPLDTVVTALRSEDDPANRDRMLDLLLDVIEARNIDGGQV